MHIAPNTPIAHKQVRRIDCFLDLQKPVIIGSPEDLLPVRFIPGHRESAGLVSIVRSENNLRVRFVDIRSSLSPEDLTQSLANLYQPFSLPALLRYACIIFPIRTKAHHGSGISPCRMDRGLRTLGLGRLANCYKSASTPQPESGHWDTRQDLLKLKPISYSGKSCINLTTSSAISSATSFVNNRLASCTFSAIFGSVKNVST